LIPASAQNGYHDLRWWNHFDQQISKTNHYKGYVKEGSRVFMKLYYVNIIGPPLKNEDVYQVDYYTDHGEILQFKFLPEAVNFENSSPGAISNFVVSQALSRWGERFDFLYAYNVCILFDNHLIIKDIRFCGSCPPEEEREMLEYAIMKSEGHWEKTNPFEQDYYLAFFTIRHYWGNPGAYRSYE
jgi:hypothetical protein